MNIDVSLVAHWASGFIAIFTFGTNVTITGTTISAKDTIYDDTPLKTRITAVYPLPIDFQKLLKRIPKVI